MDLEDLEMTWDFVKKLKMTWNFENVVDLSKNYKKLTLGFEFACYSQQT